MLRLLDVIYKSRNRKHLTNLLLTGLDAVGACHPIAICSNELGTYRCDCPSGYTGNGFDACDDIDECTEQPNICGSDDNGEVVSVRIDVGFWHFLCTLSQD